MPIEKTLLTSIDGRLQAITYAIGEEIMVSDRAPTSAFSFHAVIEKFGKTYTHVRFSDGRTAKYAAWEMRKKPATNGEQE